MRRIFVVALLALAACAKKEQQAGDTTSAAATPAGGSAAAAPASITAADVAGTWDATAMPMNKDTVVVRFEMNAKSTNDGWTMKFLPNGPSPAMRVVAIQGDSVVTEAGPYASVLRKGQQVSVHNIMHLKDGKMSGVTHAKYSNGDTTTLRIEANRKAGK